MTVLDSGLLFYATLYMCVNFLLIDWLNWGLTALSAQTGYVVRSLNTAV